MKLIFLDVDGVLNSEKHYIKLSKQGKSSMSDDMELQKHSLKYLSNLVKKTGAEVVISSTWRMGCPHDKSWLNLVNQLREYGIIPLGVTPVLWQKRGIEIQKFLDDLKDDGYTIDSMVIIDDDSDMEHLSNFLVQTSFKKGFAYWDYRKALKKLKGV